MYLHVSTCFTQLLRFVSVPSAYTLYVTYMCTYYTPKLQFLLLQTRLYFNIRMCWCVYNTYIFFKCVMTVIAISVSATRNTHRLCFSIFFWRDRGYVFISVLSLCAALTSFFHLRKKTCRPCRRMSWTRSKLLYSSCTIYNLNGFGNFYRPIYYDITCEWLYFINNIHKYIYIRDAAIIAFLILSQPVNFRHIWLWFHWNRVGTSNVFKSYFVGLPVVFLVRRLKSSIYSLTSFIDLFRHERENSWGIYVRFYVVNRK